MATYILWNDRHCIHLSLLLFKCYFSVISSSFVLICCFFVEIRRFNISHERPHFRPKDTQRTHCNGANEMPHKKPATNFTAITRRGHIILLSLQMHVFHAPQSVYALFKVKHIILYEWLFGFPLSLTPLPLSLYFSCLAVYLRTRPLLLLISLFILMCEHFYFQRMEKRRTRQQSVLSFV